MEQEKNIILRYISTFLIAFAVIFGLGLINKNLAFFGQTLHFSVNFPENKELLELDPTLQSQTIVTNSGENGELYSIPSVPITTTNTKLSLQVPKSLQLKEKNSLDIQSSFRAEKLQELQLVLLHPSGLGHLTLPLFQEDLNQLTWEKISEDGITLWQKNPTYSSLGDFFSSPPTSTPNNPTIANYQTALPLEKNTNFLSSLPEKNNSDAYFPYLEGVYTAYIFLPKEDEIQLRLNVQELNYYSGTDSTILQVYDSIGTLLASSTLKDDGITDDSRTQTEKRELSLKTSQLNPGLYRIEIGSPDAHTQLTTNQQYLVFSGSPSIVDDQYNEGNRPLQITTNAKQVAFPAWHVGATEQILAFSDDQTLSINDQRQPGDIAIHTFSDDNPNHTIVLEKNHLQIQINSSQVISFSSTSFFNPFYTTVIPFDPSLLSDHGIEYVIANYQPLSLGKNNQYEIHQSLPFQVSYLTAKSRLEILLIGSSKQGSPEYYINTLDLYLPTD